MSTRLDFATLDLMTDEPAPDGEPAPWGAAEDAGGDGYIALDGSAVGVDSHSCVMTLQLQLRQKLLVGQSLFELQPAQFCVFRHRSA